MLRVRIDEEIMKQLNFLSEELEVTRSEIVRNEIEMSYKKISFEKEKIFNMSDKYRKSFEVEDIPQECPICGAEFDLIGDVDISPYENGYRSMLMCPKCNFKKVLGYTTEDDAISDMEDDDEEDEEEDDDEDDDEEDDDDDIDNENLNDDENLFIMSKEEMLKEMEERGWECNLTEESSLCDIKEKYDAMIAEYSDLSDLFPNVRDYDAEDEDGPC